MHFKSLSLAALFTLIAAPALAEEDAAEYGSFGAEVSDGSELVAYNSFLDQLKVSKNWPVISGFREGATLDSFKGFSMMSGMYAKMIKENGGAEIPEYTTDVLGLNTLAGYRSYAKAHMGDPNFKPTPTDCGAAFVFVYPAVVSTLLFNQRPVYSTGLRKSQDQWNEMAYRYAPLVKSDFASLESLCAGSDPKVVSGLQALVANLNSDVAGVLPDVDRDYKISNYPYEAIISCGMNGQNMNVQACFKDSALKLTTHEGGKLYNIYNILQAGSMEKDGLHIDLPKEFEVAAQNSHNILVLTVTIKDSDGKTLYSDQQGQYGTVRVSN